MRPCWLLSVCLVSAAGCAPAIEPVAAPSGPTAVLWTEPEGRTDLFYGVGGPALAPTADLEFTVQERDPSGFSTTLDLKDNRGREWSAKIGPEAQSEVVASRIVWALGYPQPPAYFVEDLVVHENGGVRNDGRARLRPKVEWLDDADEPWSWHRNPFVETPPYRGLLVLMLVLNSTDLKDDNNELFVARRPDEPEALWYVVKDLGATLGETGRFNPTRNDIDKFEGEGFITGVDGARVKFEFHGRHGELFDQITVEDVKWACERLGRLTDAQWHDAFRAGGYEESVAQRYIAKIKDKIAQGQALVPERAANAERLAQ